MKTERFFKRVATAVLLTGMLNAAPYDVDIAHSSVGFKIKHLMISNVKGNFAEFSGSYDLEGGKLKALDGSIKASSIDTGIDKRDTHLKSADFFDVAKFPDITFKMTSFSGEKLTGDLTIHGVTKSVTLESEVSGTIKDPWGKTRSSISLNGTINRSDYGLTWNKALEAGGVVVGDEVKLSIELEGIAKE
jgi:polyisoprenoid-binding protein YceI